MQGQQGVGSFTETIDINHGSTSSTAAHPQLCWSNVQNAGDNRLPNYIVAPGDIGVTYVNPTGQERQAVSRLSFGGPSSSTQNEASQDEQKIDHIWSSSSSSFARNHPSSEGQHSELISHFSLDNSNSNSNTMITQGSNRNRATQNINLNADYMACGVDNFSPNICKSSGTENERMQTTGVPDPFSLPSGSGAYLEENNRSLGFPLEGSRSSCKRKCPEVSIGESSSSGNRRSLQHGETRPAVIADGSRSSLSITSLPEQVNPRISVQSRGSAYNTIQHPILAGQSSHRNIRMRINPASQPESGPPHMFPSGTSARPSSTLSSQQSLRTHPVDSLDWRTHTEPDITISQDQPALIHIPPLPRNVQPLRWNGASLSTLGSSSSSVISGNRDAPSEESNLRSSGRNRMSHPRLSSATEIRNLVPSPTNSNLGSGNLTIPRHIASALGTGTSSAVPSSAPSWVPPSNPPSRYPRRLSEYVRRSLFSPVGPESGGQGTSTSSPLRSASSTQEMLLPSGPGHQNYHQSNARSTPWMGRQGDGALAIPYPFRSSAASGEARRGRIVSEIRNVLDLIRRGEAIRLEDVMILDQSVFFNIADIHDRHRDMRLDVDNMSYEELLALEERIGNVSTGLNEEMIFSQLKQQKYSKLSNCQEDEEPCCICQEEYNDGDDIGKLDCGHDFHKDCIKQWLTHKNLCPICKTKGLAT